MEVVLEPLDGSRDEAGHDIAPALDAPVVDSSPPVETTVTTSAPAAPVKRPRGRPKGSANKPKPPPKQPEKPKKTKRPPSSSSDSSESDEPRLSKRSVVKHLMEDDMETQVLRFLTARKQNQEKQRRTLWQNLAASGLR